MDKLIRFACCSAAPNRSLWDFGSAARHHQLYNPWLDGDEAGARRASRCCAAPSTRTQASPRSVARKMADGATRARPRGRAGRGRHRRDAGAAWRCSEGHEVVDGQQLFLEARRIKTVDEISLLTQACSMVDAAYEELYEFLRPGVRENECVGLVSKVLYDLGSEYVEGVNAISGERCSPHPHVYSDRVIRPGDPAFFDILHSHIGYRTCYYRYVRGRQRLTGAARRLRPLPRVHGPAPSPRSHRARPRPTSCRCGRRAEEFGFPNEEAAFALQYGHGVGLSIWEKPIFSRLVSLDHPEVLEEGMVFALETYWPAADGWSAARIEEEVVVTADGCEVITKFPAEELLVAGRRYWTVGGALPTLRESQSHLNTAGRAPAQGR